MVLFIANKKTTSILTNRRDPYSADTIMEYEKFLTALEQSKSIIVLIACLGQIVSVAVQC